MQYKQGSCQSILKLKPVALFSIAAIVTACGGTSEENTVQMGVFIDSPVSGIEYRTESITGITDSLGQFEYLPGETIEFYLGAVVLGSAAAAEQVYLSEINGIGDPFDPIVLNKALFLMSLDADRQPANGIQIEPVTMDAARGWPALDFEATDFYSTEFHEFSMTIANVDGWGSAGGADHARRHIEQTLACANAGVFQSAHPENADSTLYTWVTASGIVQTVGGQNFPITTNLSFPTINGVFNSEEVSLLSVGTYYPFVEVDPIPYLSAYVQLLVSPVASNGSIFASPYREPLLSANSLDLVSYIYPFEFPLLAEQTIQGEIGTNGEVSMVWNNSGSSENITATRILDRSPGDIRILADYMVVPQNFDSSLFERGVVEIVISASGNIEAYRFDRNGGVSMLSVEITETDQAMNLSLYGDLGFEAILYVDTQNYTGTWLVDGSNAAVVDGTVETFIDPTSADGSTALGVVSIDTVLVCP